MQLPGPLHTLLSFTAQTPSLAFFLELALKATLVLLLALLADTLLRRRAAAHRHLPWCLGVLAIGCLPVFVATLPTLAVTYTQAPMAATAQGDMIALVSMSVTSWWPSLLQLYLGGVVLLMLYALSGLVRMLLLTRSAQPCTNARASLLLAGILDEELADITVDLREHAQLRSPLSWGLLRPVIILPTASDDWSQARLRHVLQHELSHVQRLDWVLHLFARYTCALYWYHPLAWLALRRLDELAEQACDDAVLLQDAQDTAYAGDLVAVARSARRAQGAWMANFLANSFLATRVRAILDRTRTRHRNESTHVFRAVLVSALAAALLGATELELEREFFQPVPERRYLTVNFLPAFMDVPAANPIIHQQPERLLPEPVPRLEPVYIHRDPPARTSSRVESPMHARITITALPGAAGDSRLRLLDGGKPGYPRSAEMRGIEGSVTVEYAIDASGSVIDPRIIEAQPRKVFDDSVLETLSGYHYDPPRLDGQAVGVTGLRTRFVFQLDPDPG